MVGLSSFLTLFPSSDKFDDLPWMLGAFWQFPAMNVLGVLRYAYTPVSG